MRILVISNLYPPIVRGGYERECAGVVDHLRREHDVLVLTSRHARGSAPSDPRVLRVLPLLEPDWRGSIRAPLASVLGVRAMRAALAAFEPDLIYVWNGAQLPAASVLTAMRTGAPVAFRVCEYWFGGFGIRDQFLRHVGSDDRGLRALWALLLRQVNRLPGLQFDHGESFGASICWNSEYVRAAAPAPPAVVPTHEDLIFPALPQGDRFAGLVRTPAERPTIALIGRITPEKGPDVACRAIESLRRRHGIEADLAIVGPVDAGTRRWLEQLTERLGIGSLVDFRGQLDTDGLAAVLAGAHAVVIPPTWQEPAPLICTEAALAGVPVVASISGGIPEMLHDREHALLFEIGDADACADRLAETLRDEEETAARTGRASERAAELAFGPYIEATDRFVTAALGGAEAGTGPAPSRG